MLGLDVSLGLRQRRDPRMQILYKIKKKRGKLANYKQEGSEWIVLGIFFIIFFSKVWGFAMKIQKYSVVTS